MEKDSNIIDFRKLSEIKCPKCQKKIKLIMGCGICESCGFQINTDPMVEIK